MRKPTTFDYILGFGILLLFTWLCLYIGSHPKTSICDTQPDSQACAQETQADNDQYLQSGSH